MITVGMNYQVLEGKEEIFENAFAGVIKALDKADGHKKSNLFKDVANKSSYLIISDWNDETAFSTFIKSDSFKSVTNWGKEQILAGRPDHQVYRQGEPVGG
jgi:heme-degrading monooxygenase HmoA